MGERKAERLAGELNDFIASSPNVEAAAVVSFDGLTMASALPEVMDDDRVGAMSAALLSLGEQAAQGLGRGELSQIFVEADQGFVFLMSARDQAVLVAVTDAAAKIGFILFEMRRAAESIGDVLATRAVAEPEPPPAPVAVADEAEEYPKAFSAPAEPVHAEPVHAAPGSWQRPEESVLEDLR